MVKIVSFEECYLRRCGRCLSENGKCEVCQTAWEVQLSAADSSHCAGEGSRRTRAKVTLEASRMNMHELGRNFVEEVVDVREVKVSTEEGAATGGHLEFKCRIPGLQKDTRTQARTSPLEPSDQGLR